MPDRYLREALLRSDRWNACAVDARDLYVRLMMIVDDYGCFDGRDNVIAQQAYFMGRHEALPLTALQEVGLIVRYLNAGKLYIALMRWGETLRGRRRWPAPPVCNDLPEIKYRGKYGTPINFRNPTGCDAVSILVDVHGRPVMPQPPEWRRVDSDWTPVLGAAQRDNAGPEQSLHASPVSHSPQLLRAVTSPQEPMHAVTAGKDSARSVVSSHRTEVKDQSSAVQVSAISGPSNSAQSLAAPTPTPGNGKYELDDNGAWAGVSDAQRARWQEMFSEMSVPDQIERAGAWLVAHPAERKLYTERGELEQYLIRWMLNESRQIAERTVRAKAGPDSQGKR
jgi:hypothetical protein